MKRLLLSRTTIMALILATLTALLAGSFIPQRFLLSPAGMARWRHDHPDLAPLAEKLGLLHVYTHPGFACLLALIGAALLLSCIEQVKLAWRLTRSGSAGMGGERAPVNCSPAVADTLVRAQGYLPVGGLGTCRYVRHPWGYWGNALLHLGMLVVIVASLWIALTQQRGTLHLADGETHRSSQPMDQSETGLLAGNYLLPVDVRMDRIDWQSGPDNALQDISSSLTFLSQGVVVGNTKTAVNAMLHHGEDRIYQGLDRGHALYLEIFSNSRPPETFQLLMDHPEASDRFSYKNFPGFLEGSDLLRAKYSLDSTAGSPAVEKVHLVVRVDAPNGTQLGQLPLTLGGEGQIGPYRFRLRETRRWSTLIFIRLSGIAGVFTGFFIVVLGSILNYFTPPRELLLQVAGDGTWFMTWRAAKFGVLYQDEFERLQQELGSGSYHG